eukprot:6214674-Pleurochrysis_carterae.AAC.4
MPIICAIRTNEAWERDCTPRIAKALQADCKQLDACHASSKSVSHAPAPSPSTALSSLTCRPLWRGAPGQPRRWPRRHRLALCGRNVLELSSRILTLYCTLN